MYKPLQMHLTPRRIPAWNHAIRICLLLFFCVLMCNHETRAADSELEALRTTYFKALKDADAVEKGMKMLENLPTSPLVTAYRGSFLCLQARDSYWPLRKWNKAQDGLKLLDKAISAKPQSLEIRVLRAAVTHHLPGFFNRSKQAEEDISWIKKQMQQPEFKQLPKKIQTFITNFIAETEE